jgi:hypothetical protein
VFLRKKRCCYCQPPGQAIEGYPYTAVVGRRRLRNKRRPEDDIRALSPKSRIKS